MEQETSHLQRRKKPSSGGTSPLAEETCSACVTQFTATAAVGGPHCRECKARLWCPSCIGKRGLDDDSDDASPISVQLGGDGHYYYYCLGCAKDVLIAHAKAEGEEARKRKRLKAKSPPEWCLKHCGGGATTCADCDSHICGHNESGYTDEANGCRPCYHCDECNRALCKSCHWDHLLEKHFSASEDDSTGDTEEDQND